MGPTFTVGDFNARIQKKLSDNETPIGTHLFDRHNDTLDSRTPEDKVRGNRSLFLGHCIDTNCIIASSSHMRATLTTTLSAKSSPTCSV